MKRVRDIKRRGGPQRSWVRIDLMVQRRLAATLAVAALACSMQGCATCALVEWAQPGPDEVEIPIRTSNFDGTMTTTYGRPLTGELLVKNVCGIVAIGPVLAWDLVTMPVQVLGGYPPYGGDAPSSDAGGGKAPAR